MRAALLGWLLVPLGLALACGGKLSRTGEGEEGDGTQSSGGAASGATTGQGGSSRAGAPSKGGGPTQAGQPSMGGACACGAVDCAPGFVPIPEPSGCCYTCEPIACPAVPCAIPNCPPGSRLEMPPGACCPECARDNCAAARDEYLQYSRRLIEKYHTIGCMTDQQCGVYYEKNSCNLSCGTPMTWDAFTGLDQELQAYAKICDGCPFPDVPPCTPTGEPRCISGRCQLGFGPGL